jgi:hypothetical protein
MTKRLRIRDECSEAMDRLNDEAKKNNQIPEVRAASVFHNRWQRPWQHCTRLLRLQRAVKDGLVPAAGVLVMKEDRKSSKKSVTRFQFAQREPAIFPEASETCRQSQGR